MAANADVTKAIEILQEKLPGFAAELRPAYDTIQVRGPIYFAAQAGVELFYYVPEHGAERFAEEMVRVTRQHGIEKLGLQETIDELVRDAYERGKFEGFQNGKSSGITQGRKEMLAEILAAKEDDDAER